MNVSKIGKIKNTLNQWRVETRMKNIEPKFSPNSLLKSEI